MLTNEQSNDKWLRTMNQLLCLYLVIYWLLRLKLTKRDHIIDTDMIWYCLPLNSLTVQQLQCVSSAGVWLQRVWMHVSTYNENIMSAFLSAVCNRRCGKGRCVRPNMCHCERGKGLSSSCIAPSSQYASQAGRHPGGMADRKKNRPLGCLTDKATQTVTIVCIICPLRGRVV